jgi:hypothetical protein
MKRMFKRFLAHSGYMAAAFFVIYLALWRFFPGPYLSVALPVMIPFFYVITASVYFFMLRSAENRFPRFMRSFMVMTFGKILLYAILIIVYALFNRSDAFAFVVAFFILYLAFTVFEVTYFLQDSKKMGK